MWKMREKRVGNGSRIRSRRRTKREGEEDKR
jgi:hypothetical protein